MPGPAEALFQREYYALLKAALRSGGILISQGMCDSDSSVHWKHCMHQYIAKQNRLQVLLQSVLPTSRSGK